MAQTIYLLCAGTSLVCTILLYRGYRRTRSGLLLWSSLCFIGLTLNNALLVIDRLVVEDVDLATWRLVPAVAGLGALVYGLVWDGK